MNEENLVSSPQAVNQSKKYALATKGFLAINGLYPVWIFVFMPQVKLDLYSLLFVAIYLGLIGTLALLVSREKKRLTQVLALLFGARSLSSIYLVTLGDALAGVEYIIPFMIFCSYLLGRACWDWP
jgi:hypothetical protein